MIKIRYFLCGHDSDLYSSGIDLCKYESSGCSTTGIAAELYL